MGLKLPGKSGSGGKTLEAMVARGGAGVVLTQVPQASRTIYRRGQPVQIRIAGPVDFVGCFPGGRMIAIDAKECSRVTSFDAGADKVPAHQRDELIRFGRSGAVAGLLIRQVKAERLRWLDWTLLLAWRPTYPWPELPDVGPATAYQVGWPAVLREASGSG